MRMVHSCWVGLTQMSNFLKQKSLKSIGLPPTRMITLIFKMLALHISLDTHFNPHIQIYVESGTSSSVRAPCVLMTGVRMSRMTEPSDAEEWWLLPEKMRAAIERCRIAWDNSPQYVPKALPIKRRLVSKTAKPMSWRDNPLIMENSVSEVRHTSFFISENSSHFF